MPKSGACGGFDFYKRGVAEAAHLKPQGLASCSSAYFDRIQHELSL
nr:hypothetical protein RVX_3026 [Nitratidesulfovibrio sp. HK-II]